MEKIENKEKIMEGMETENEDQQNIGKTENTKLDLVQQENSKMEILSEKKEVPEKEEIQSGKFFQEIDIQSGKKEIPEIPKKESKIIQPLENPTKKTVPEKTDLEETKPYSIDKFLKIEPDLFLEINPESKKGKQEYYLESSDEIALESLIQTFRPNSGKTESFERPSANMDGNLNKKKFRPEEEHDENLLAQLIEIARKTEKSTIPENPPGSISSPKPDFTGILEKIGKSKNLVKSENSQIRNRLETSQILLKLKDEQIGELMREWQCLGEEVDRLRGLLESNKVITLLKDSQLEELEEENQVKAKQILELKKKLETAELRTEKYLTIEAEVSELRKKSQKQELLIIQLRRENRKTIILNEQHHPKSAVTFATPEISVLSDSTDSSEIFIKSPRSFPGKKHIYASSTEASGSTTTISDEDFILLMNVRQRMNECLLGDREPTEEDMCHFTKLLSHEYGRRFFYPLLLHACGSLGKHTKKELLPGSFELMVSLMDTTLDALKIDTGGDYICAKIILEVSYLLYKKTAGTREFVKDIINNHVAWQNLSFWEEYFWDSTASKEPLTLSGLPTEDLNKAQRSQLIQTIRLFAVKMIEWGHFPAETIRQFLHDVTPSLGVSNEEETIMEKVNLLFEKKKLRVSKNDQEGHPMSGRSTSTGQLSSASHSPSKKRPTLNLWHRTHGSDPHRGKSSSESLRPIEEQGVGSSPEDNPLLRSSTGNLLWNRKISSGESDKKLREISGSKKLKLRVVANDVMKGWTSPRTVKSSPVISNSRNDTSIIFPTEKHSPKWKKEEIIQKREVLSPKGGKGVEKTPSKKKK